MPVTPRDAATVILARPRPGGGYEVLMTRRPETMRFMGGMFVFPGGALDPTDAMLPATLRAEDALERLGEDVPDALASGLFACAARELFEEVGALLAADASGEPVEPARVRMLAGRRGGDFGDLLRGEGLTLDTAKLVWHGRLITPEMSPIRFDARFFVAPMPGGQELVLDTDEVVEAIWISPAEAMRAAETSSLPIPIPTMAILQGLIEVPAYEQLMAGKRHVKEILSAPLSPRVSYVLAPNPGVMTGPGTNTYIVGGERVAIVDPAVPDGIFIERLVRLAWTDKEPAVVLLTHMHPDHIGGAAVIAEQTGCPVAAWKGIADPLVTRHLDDGETIDLGGATIRAIHTPGHASHHMCYLLEEERSLFAGDVVAGLGTVVIAPPDGDMAEYLRTLEMLAGLGVERIYPGHGPVVEHGPAKLAEYIAHRRDRERQVLEALSAGDDEIPAMVRRIYADVNPVLHPVAELSVRAHLEMLEAEGRARREGDRWALAG